MLHPERIPLNEAEEATVEKLLAEHGDGLAGFSRRDPGDTGPLLISLHDGTEWEIKEKGTRRRVS